MTPLPLSPYEEFIAQWREKVSAQGFWEPPITQKQAALAAYKEKYILASGPRHSTKTAGTLYALASHLYFVPDASVAFVSVSQTNAADSGAWVDLTETIIPTWIAGDFGMKWIEQPRATTYTHKPYCVVTNDFGGKGRVQLYSLDDERDVEKLFKNKSFTMIYITELSKFKRMETFVILKDCLRGIGRPDHHFKFLADTNPADEGTDSWIYKLWYGAALEPDPNDFQKQFRLAEFSLDDNPFYTETKKQEIRQSYEYDPDLYKRMILGHWLKVADGSFFQSTFRRSLHVFPDEMIPDEEMTLQEGCSKLITGTDIGSGTNHAGHIIEPFWHKNRKCYKILDELVSVGFEISIEDFTRGLLERMEFWEKEAGKQLPWDHWSDADAFQFSSAAKEYKHRIVYAASNGRIELRATDKGPGSVLPRLSLLQRLFYEDRLFINKRCVKTIQAIQNLKRVDPKRMVSKTNPIDPRDENKHPIDSLSYAILMDLGEEAHTSMLLASKKKTPGVISMAI